MDLDPQVLGQALQYLDKIGEKIGMTAETIWPWLVRQQYVYIGTSLVIFIIACILIPFALYLSKKYHPWNDKKYGTEEADFVRVFRCVVIALAIVIGAAGLVAMFINGPKFFNPEFYALKDLIKLIK